MVPSDVCAATVIANDESMRASSSMARWRRTGCRRRCRRTPRGWGCRAGRAQPPCAARRAETAAARRAPRPPGRPRPRRIRAPCRGTAGARPRGRDPLSARYRPRTMPGVNETSLARYADAIVRDGLLIGPGDMLAVHPEPIQRELAVALTEAGYRAGARFVRRARDRSAHHARTRAGRAGGHARLAPGLGGRAHARARARGRGHRLDRGQRESAGVRRRAPGRVPPAESSTPGPPAYRRAVGRADARFVVVAWPTPAWAAQVYPELTRRGRAGRARQRPAALRPARRGRSRRTAGGVHAERLAERAAQAERARPARAAAARRPAPICSSALPAGTTLARRDSTTCAATASRRTSPPRRCSRARRRGDHRHVPLHTAAGASRVA